MYEISRNFTKKISQNKKYQNVNDNNKNIGSFEKNMDY